VRREDGVKVIARRSPTALQLIQPGPGFADTRSRGRFHAAHGAPRASLRG